MIRKQMILLLLILVPTFLWAQQEYGKTGYATLVVKFSGNYPADKNIVMSNYASPLTVEKPVDFLVVNDSTLLLSIFTYGSALLNFQLDHQYKLAILLPNQVAELEVNYLDATQSTLRYKGEFKEIFDASNEIGGMLRDGLFSDYFVSSKENSLPTALDYKKFITHRIDSMTTSITAKASSNRVKNFFKQLTTPYLLNDFLLDGYEKSYKIRHQEDMPVPHRDLNFYQNLIPLYYADNLAAATSPFNLVKGLLEDPFLNLPSISEGSAAYSKRLEAVFGKEANVKNRLFYEQLIAAAFLKITKERALTPTEKFDLINYFENKEVTNYILAQQHNTLSAGKGKSFYLPFDQAKTTVYPDILAKYKNKVVIVDFWATWCGPCIEAFSESKKVKDLYADRDDVVFIYITGESSVYESWAGYVANITGDHYYLYTKQERDFTSKYNIEALPGYLLFNKKGELAEKSVSGYMGNDTLIKWIDNALKE